MMAVGLGLTQASPLSTGSQSLFGILNPLSGGLSALAAAELSAIATWVLGATKAALTEAAHAIDASTSPALTSAWFSSTYWRVAGLAAMITVPFICAAALQAVIRSDLAQLAQSVLIHLPLALVAVSLAAPVTMLLLAATDGMCTAVSGPGGADGARFLMDAGAYAGGLSVLDGSPFFAVIAGVITAAAALALTVELLVREAAVDVVVLMLPLVFAAFVWPARRIWAVRMIELLVGLILSKFVVVAVLALAGTALGSGTGDSRLLTAMALVVLSTFAPWVMLRLLPFTELAAGVAEALSHSSRRVSEPAQRAVIAGAAAHDFALSMPAMLRRDHDAATAAMGPSDGARGSGAAPSDDDAMGLAAAEVGSAGDPQGEADDGRPGGTTPPPDDSHDDPDLPPIWHAPNRTWPAVQLNREHYFDSIAGTEAEPPEDAEL
jgi:hypothetical protein